MKKYFIYQDDEKKGPFDLEELSSKNISSNTLVWTEGMKTWGKADSQEELSILLKKLPPEIPISNKQNNFKNNVEFNRAQALNRSKILISRSIILNLKILILVTLLSSPFAISYFFNSNKGFRHMEVKELWEAADYRYMSSYIKKEKYNSSSLFWLVNQSKVLGFWNATKFDPNFSSSSYFEKFIKYHDRSVSRALEKSIFPALITSLITAVLFLLIRYFFIMFKRIIAKSKEPI